MLIYLRAKSTFPGVIYARISATRNSAGYQTAESPNQPFTIAQPAR